jgi:hypothetical protein
MKATNPLVAMCAVEAYKRYCDSGFIYRHWAFFAMRSDDLVMTPGFFLLSMDEDDPKILKRENKAIKRMAKMSRIFAICVCIVIPEEDFSVKFIASRVALRTNNPSQNKGFIMTKESLASGKYDFDVCDPSAIDIPWEIKSICKPSKTLS